MRPLQETHKRGGLESREEATSLAKMTKRLYKNSFWSLSDHDIENLSIIGIIDDESNDYVNNDPGRINVQYNRVFSTKTTRLLSQKTTLLVKFAAYRNWIAPHTACCK